MAIETSGSVKEDGERLALRAQPRPVIRINRTLLILVGAVLGAIVLVGLWWGLRPVTSSRLASAQEVVPAAPVSHVASLDALPKDYGEAVPMAVASSYVEPVQAFTATDPADAYTGAASEQVQADVMRQQAREAAAQAPVFFAGIKSEAHSGAEGSAADRQVPASLNAPTLIPTNNSGEAEVAATPAAGSQAHKQTFMTGMNESNSTGLSAVQEPKSPYLVTAGTLFSAALLTGINSDLPGQVIATITEPVYDTATGRYLLIPQGSRLIGRYDSQIAFGQRRVLLLWQRLILPDTSSIALDRLPGIDTAGYAGLTDGVDWHWDRILAGAAVSTLLGVGAELAAPDRSGGDGRVIIATRDGLQRSVNTVGQELSRRNLDIQPTLTVRLGFPLRIMVNNDLVLRPYQPLTFQHQVGK